MLNRRDLLGNTIRGSSLVALGSTVPAFVAAAAHAAEPKKEKVLVILEMTGGNDGLNTVVPYGDDLYYKSRPTLGIPGNELVKVNDHIGLNRSLQPMASMFEDQKIAIVQGVGYPNPTRSHFASMDIWQRGSRRKMGSGWLGRTIGGMQVASNQVPAFFLGQGDLPLAMQGSATAVPSLNSEKPFGLDLIDAFYGHQGQGGTTSLAAPPTRKRAAANKGDKVAKKRKDEIERLTKLSKGKPGSLLDTVKKTTLDTYSNVDRIATLLNKRVELPEGAYTFRNGGVTRGRSGLLYELMLTARMIAGGFGARIFYVQLPGFDTHSDQAKEHNNLLATMGRAVNAFFNELKKNGDDDRVVLMTYSEFGRRVRENGSKGTDHGAASNMFVVGSKVKGGVVGEHPSLQRLAGGDLKYHTDFRQVYATLLDKWLEVRSRDVLGEQFKHLPLL